MQYIIMCGGEYPTCGEYKSKHFIEIDGEPLVARTIRLLKEAGVKDIAISTANKAFEVFGVPLVNPKSHFSAIECSGYWVDGFYRTNNSVCYLFGDVFFSPKAIKTIVEEKVDDIQFFASAPPFGQDYRKNYAEPFAFKVQNVSHFHQAVEMTKGFQDRKLFYRMPIAWELWQVIKGTPLNHINYDNFRIINDYTCDIDSVYELEQVLSLIQAYGYLEGE